MKKSLSAIVAASFLICAFALVSFTNTTKEVDNTVNTPNITESTTIASDYTVVRGSHASDLVNMVKYKMAQGWQLHGGVSHNGMNEYLQAMVK